MTVNSQQAYSQSVGISSTNSPVVFQRDPISNDVYFPIGQFWINQTSNKLWYLNSKSNASGILQASWQQVSLSSVLSTLSDTGNTHVISPSSGSDSPPNNIQIAGGAGITVTASGNTITISSSVSAGQTITGNDGNPVPFTSGNISTVGDTSIYVSGNIGTSTLTAKVVSTNHTLLVGRGATTSSVALPVGGDNQVLLGHTAADPSWGSVPNASLSNSSITINTAAPLTGGGTVALGSSINLGITTPISVSNGGTGGSSFDKNAIILAGSTIAGNAPFDDLVAGTAGTVLTSAGPGVIPIWSNPSKINTSNPAFLYTTTAGQTNTTGNGTLYKVLFGNIVFDQASNVSGSTFTAPSTAIYLIGANLYISSASLSSATIIEIDFYVNGALAYTIWYVDPNDLEVSGTMEVSGSQLMKLSAGDTVTVQLTVSGISKNVSVLGGNFSGILLS